MTATYKTDNEIATRERQKGWAAKQDGRPITDCPWNGGVCEHYWKEGWNGYIGSAVAH